MPQPSLSARRGSGQSTGTECPFCPSGFLVNRDNGAVDEHILRIGIAAEGLEQLLKYTAAGPPSEAAELAVPRRNPSGGSSRTEDKNTVFGMDDVRILSEIDPKRSCSNILKASGTGGKVPRLCQPCAATARSFRRVCWSRTASSWAACSSSATDVAGESAFCLLFPDLGAGWAFTLGNRRSLMFGGG